jgi:hypothetical protein
MLAQITTYRWRATVAEPTKRARRELAELLK